MHGLKLNRLAGVGAEIKRADSRDSYRGGAGRFKLLKQQTGSGFRIGRAFTVKTVVASQLANFCFIEKIGCIKGKQDQIFIA
jgi:hypothetical protein